MKKLFSYTVPRPFYNFNIPIAFQSTIIRDYAKKNNFNFSLPTTELVKANSYFMLSNIFNNDNLISDFAVVSGFVYPIDNIEIIKKIFKSYKLKNKIKFHLILESKVLQFNELISWCEDIKIKNNLIYNF